MIPSSRYSSIGVDSSSVNRRLIVLAMVDGFGYVDRLALTVCSARPYAASRSSITAVCGMAATRDGGVVPFGTGLRRAGTAWARLWQLKGRARSQRGATQREAGRRGLLFGFLGSLSIYSTFAARLGQVDRLWDFLTIERRLPVPHWSGYRSFRIYLTSTDNRTMGGIVICANRHRHMAGQPSKSAQIVHLARPRYHLTTTHAASKLCRHGGLCVPGPSI